MDRKVAFQLAEFLANKAETVREDWGIEFDNHLLNNTDVAMSEEDLEAMDNFMNQIAEKVVELAETLV